MPSRNAILIVGLVLFLVGYVAYWAYNVQYLEPRQRLNNEIETLSGQIEGGQNRLAGMTQFASQNIGLFYRTLPQNPNDANSQYSFWLLELLLYSGFENNHVNHGSPARLPTGASFQFTFSVRSTATLEQLSYFLFEFYHAPFLHRIASLTLRPIEGNTEQMDISISINALVLDLRQFDTIVGALNLNVPHLPRNQLPTGNIARLAAFDLAPYQVIWNRNLLQTARGGIDRADYTFLTGIVELSGETEVWFTVRTDNSRIGAKLGDSIQSGSFSGRLVEILDDDIVLERNGERWLLTAGESLNQAFALPPETAVMSE